MTATLPAATAAITHPLTLPRPVPTRSWHVPIAITAAIVVVATLFAVAWICGMRWFVVQTPSMARTAPVGTLVVTAPLTTHAQVDDVVAFKPPGLTSVYTHRVVTVLPNGAIRTRGDLNSALDGWTTPSSRILGHAVAIIPGAGFVLESMPALLVGAVALFLSTKLFRRSDRRIAARVLGAHLLVAVIVALRHPFVAMTVVALQITGRHENALVVSTGILPIKISTGGRTLAHLIDGQLASVSISHLDAAQTAMHATLDLAWWQYGILLASTLLPAACFLAIGGRSPSEEDSTQS